MPLSSGSAELWRKHGAKVSLRAAQVGETGDLDAREHAAQGTAHEGSDRRRPADGARPGIVGYGGKGFEEATAARRRWSNCISPAADPSQYIAEARLEVRAARLFRWRSWSSVKRRDAFEDSNRMRGLMFRALVVFLALFPVLSWCAPGRVALVVGINAYSNVAPLINAVRDAESIAAELKEIGFAVTLLKDANRRTLVREIREFSRRAEGGAEAVFFYAGHGLQIQNTNLLLPSDFQGRDEEEAHDEGVRLDWISNMLREAKARFSLLIIDACRNNPLPRTAGARVAGGERGLAPISPAVGQMVVFSAGTGQEALDRLGNNDSDKNSVFVREFLRQIRRPGMPVDQLVRDVRDSVERLAASVKHAQRPAIYDESKGQFFFIAGLSLAPGNTPSTASPTIPTLPSGSAGVTQASAARTAEQIEDDTWSLIKDSETIADLESYLTAHPKGRYSLPAKIKIDQLLRRKGAVSINNPLIRLWKKKPDTNHNLTIQCLKDHRIGFGLLNAKTGARRYLRLINRMMNRNQI